MQKKTKPVCQQLGSITYDKLRKCQRLEGTVAMAVAVAMATKKVHAICFPHCQHADKQCNKSHAFTSNSILM